MPRKTTLNSFRDGLIQKHPQVFNAFLIFALISLVVTGAFLISDIMSFKSSAAQKEKGTELMEQCKSVLGLNGTDNAAAKNATDNDSIRELLARNRLAKALEAGTIGGNLSHMQNLSSSTSLLTQTAVQPAQAISPTMIDSTESEGGSDTPIESEGGSDTPIESEGGSDTPIYSFGDGSSKGIEGSHRVDAVASNLSQNQPRSNETDLNESIMNEPVLDESVLNDSILNEPIQGETIMNKSVRNSTYSFVTRNTNRSFDNLSSGSLAFAPPQMNFAASNSTEIHEGLAPSKNDSDVSATQELKHKNNETNYQNETSYLNSNENGTQEKKTRNESMPILLDQRNITSDAPRSRNNNTSVNSTPDKSSNIISPQINISPEGHTNSAPTRETISANNNSSQNQEPKQNQTNNRAESERNSARSSLSFPPLLNSKTEGVQNHAGTNNNQASSVSGSTMSQESKKSQTNSVNRFRSLKLPTPSWMTNAGSMNKIKKIK
jgi:hypothetical protein